VANATISIAPAVVLKKYTVPVSDAATYSEQHQSPTCPPAASGITIGIGQRAAG